MSEATAGERRATEQLVNAGVPEDEARVFVYLSKARGAKAAAVAQALDLARSDAYRVLDRLVERGFVARTSERPARHEPVSPAHLADALVHEAETRARRLRGGRDELVRALEEIRGGGERDPGRSPLRVLRGRVAILAALDRMTRDAEVEIAGVSTDPTAVPMMRASGLAALAADRAREGLAVRILLGLFPHAGGPEELPGEIRCLESPAPVRFVLVDRREVLLWVATDPSPDLVQGDDVAIWTSSPDVAANHAFFFETLWRAAIPLAKALPR